MTNKNKNEEKNVRNSSSNIISEAQNIIKERNIDQILNQLENNIPLLKKTLCKQNQCLPHRPTTSTDGCSVIDVAFEARMPSLSDFNGIKTLLKQLFTMFENEELARLSHLIIEQSRVGCVLKRGVEDDSDDESEDSSDDDEQSDDDKVFAVNTVISVSKNQNLPCIKKICDLLIAKCRENYKEDPSRIANALGDPSKQIGLIISERCFYIPPQMALPTYRSLKSDIENALPKNKRFDFTHLIMISKLYIGKAGQSKENELLYHNAEEKLFKEMSEFSYTFSAADLNKAPSDDTPSNYEPFRMVMMFSGKALSQMISKLQAALVLK